MAGVGFVVKLTSQFHDGGTHRLHGMKKKGESNKKIFVDISVVLNSPLHSHKRGSKSNE